MRTIVSTSAFILVISIIYAAAATRAETQTIVVTQSACAGLVRHQPSTDVAYKPGVDVAGRSVTPADLGGGLRMEPPKDFEIPITLDLQKKLGIPADPRLYQTDQFKVGTVTYRDGRAYFNGQPLQDEAAVRLSELCQAQSHTIR